VLGNLLKRFVCRCKDSVVGLGAVEGFDKVVVLVDKLCKLCCVLALVDKLIYCPVGFVVSWRMMRPAMMRRPMVGWWLVVGRPMVGWSIVGRPVMRWSIMGGMVRVFLKLDGIVKE